MLPSVFNPNVLGLTSGTPVYYTGSAFASMLRVTYAASGTIEQITAGATTDIPLLLKGFSSGSTGNLLECQDSSNNKVGELRPFGRMVVNQISADSPDNDLAGASTILHLKNNGSSQFAIFSDGKFYVKQNIDLLNASTPVGLTYGNSKIQVLNGTGDLGLVTKDAASSFVTRTGNPSGSAVTVCFALQLDPTASPSAGMGAALEFQLKSSTTNDQPVGRVTGVWASPTHASRKGRVVISAIDSGGERECVRGEASGTVPMLGFYGATAVVQPATTGTTTGFTAGAGTNVTDASTFTGGTGSTAYRISDIVLALKQLGLIAA